jgi:secretory lipase
VLHRLRTIIAITFAFGFASCSSPTITPAPFAPSSSRLGAAPARGSIVWIKKVTVFRKRALSGAHTNGTLGFAEQVVTQLGGAPKFDVALYAILYRTVGVNGEPATASAAFFIPIARNAKPYTLIGYGQGTNVVKAQKITHPTAVNIEPQLQAAIFAAHGYAMVATDYLGLGYSNYPFEPYLVVNAEASAVIDSMRAARIAAKRLHVPLSGDVFLTGYSQGGQTSLGTQKVIEARDTGEFRLIANSPSSGPYALTQTLLDGLAHQGQNAAVLSTFILTAYNKTYANVYTDASSVFQDPYATYVTNLLPVKTYARASKLQGTLLPLNVKRLLQPSFMSSFASDASSPARKDVARNDLLDGWTPKAPVYFCGGKRDPQVEFKNAISAYDYFKRRGATVQLLDVDKDVPPSVPRSQYHDAVLVLCHTLERVAVLDSRKGPARPGTWPASLRGPIGPITYPPLLP